MENNCVYGKSFFSYFTEINILQEWKYISFHLFNFTGISSLLFVNVNVSLCTMPEVSSARLFVLAQGFKQDSIETDGTVIRYTICDSGIFVRFCLSPNRNRLIFKNVEMLNVLKYNSCMFFPSSDE